MNKLISELAEYVGANKAPYRLAEDNENVIWFKTGLPKNNAAPVVYISYEEKSGIFYMMLSNLFKLTGAGIDLYQIINEFNADNGSFNCKMFIDREGDIVVNCSSVIEAKDALAQVNEYISVAVSSIDKYYGRIEELLEKNSAENSAE